jgi:hypothetical protein
VSHEPDPFLDGFCEMLMSIKGLGSCEHAVYGCNRSQVGYGIAQSTFNSILRGDVEPFQTRQLSLVLALRCERDQLTQVGGSPLGRFGVQARKQQQPLLRDTPDLSDCRCGCPRRFVCGGPRRWHPLDHRWGPGSVNPQSLPRSHGQVAVDHLAVANWHTGRACTGWCCEASRGACCP